MNSYERRANLMIKDLNSAIELENETINATSSDDRKTGCRLRIQMAEWGIKICNFILAGKEESQ